MIERLPIETGLRNTIQQRRAGFGKLAVMPILGLTTSRGHMPSYSDVVYPHKGTQALNPQTGSIRFSGTLSSGELAFAKIAKVVVEYGWALDGAGIDELNRLMRG